MSPNSITRSVKAPGYFLSWVIFDQACILYATLTGWPSFEILYFQFIDFVAGENFHSKLLIDLPDAITMRLILAEIVIIVEELHNVNVLHGDLHAENILINSDGHFVLTDFGFSNWFSSNKVSELDWSQLSQMCHHIFSEPIEHVHELSLIKMLANMTDAQLPGNLFE